jgi:hypothetical protein
MPAYYKKQGKKEEGKEVAMDILKKAHEIIYERSEEKERQYGPMSLCNKKASEIATVLCNKKISIRDLYMMQISLKLARESHAHKEDNLLDLVAYIAGYNNYENNTKTEEKDITRSEDE